MQAKARAYVNFALIKYWGKQDERLKLPYQSSISFTVDQFYTETKVTCLEELREDVVYLDGKQVHGEMYARIVKWLSFLRETYQMKSFVQVETKNEVPYKAGLASSSSAFAALTLSATKAYGLNLSKKEQSRLARIGSGSATRSIYGGFVSWQVGNDFESVSMPIDVIWDDFRMIVIIVSKSEKNIGSTEAMKRAVESPLYQSYIKKSMKDYEAMIVALKQKDIRQVGKIAEENCDRMHELMASTKVFYKTEETEKIIRKVKALREKGILVYYTIDAGANVKLISLASMVERIIDAFKNYEYIVCKKGNDAHDL